MRFYVIVFIAGVLPMLTAPWWFSTAVGSTALGLPLWATVSLATSAAVALLSGWVIGGHWQTFADRADALNSKTGDEQA